MYATIIAAIIAASAGIEASKFSEIKLLNSNNNSNNNKISSNNNNNILQITKSKNVTTSTDQSHHLALSTSLCTFDFQCTGWYGPNSQCYKRRCICALGYRFGSSGCVPIACNYNFDCTRNWLNSRCNLSSLTPDGYTHRCVCDYGYYLDRTSQTCFYPTSFRQVGVPIIVVLVFIIIGISIFLAIRRRRNLLSSRVMMRSMFASQPQSQPQQRNNFGFGASGSFFPNPSNQIPYQQQQRQPYPPPTSYVGFPAPHAVTTTQTAGGVGYPSSPPPIYHPQSSGAAISNDSYVSPAQAYPTAPPPQQPPTAPMKY